MPVTPVLVPDRELEHVTDGTPPALEFDEDEAAELGAVSPPAGNQPEPEPVLQYVSPDPVPVVLEPEPEGQSVAEPESVGQDAPALPGPTSASEPVVETEGPPALPPRTLPVVPVPSSGRGAVSRIVSNSGARPKTIVDTGTRPKVPPKIVVSKGGARVCLLYTSPSPRDKRQSRMPSSA